ncbi:MAG: M1 family metallopeptidase [Anaerolineales bacterium]|nr:M1 family metallopeptidase [Anaerolineales bacterium]
MIRYIFRITTYALMIVFLSACASPTPTPQQNFAPFILVTQDPNASPTLTPFQPSGEINTLPATFTQAPPATATATITLTPPPTASRTAPPPPPVAFPLGTTGSNPSTSPSPSTSSRTNYILYSTLDFAGKTVSTDQTIRYYNNTGVSLSEIVFSVQPNRYGNAFILNSISQDGLSLTSYSLNGQRMTVSLPQPLAPGSATTFALNFKLNIPQKAADGVFGYDFNQVNLVDWYPFIVPYQGGWVLYDPMPWGEHLVYDSSDIELNLKKDSDVTIAAGATPDQNGDWTRYRMYGARTFALSASDEFLVSESTTGNVVIRSYYFDGYKTGGDGILNLGTQAVGTFSAQFAPYPHQTLAIVQSDMHDGMEYDGVVFLATDFYGQYTGGSRGNLATIGVHEIAHQWWYGLVGNDQAIEPWLDEALAIYSERIFYENNYPANISWWWQFRVDYFKPSGYVDTSIYNGGSFRSYTNAVYLNGAHFMDDLRQRMGYGNFSKFLKEYARRYSYGHATSADFFALAREIINVDISDLVGNYFAGSY